MKYFLRFVLPLSLMLIAIAALITPLIDKLTTRWFTRDLDLRSQLIINSLDESVSILITDENDTHKERIHEILKRFTLDERLLAVAICSSNHKIIYKTDLFPPEIFCNFDDKTNENNDSLMSSFLELPNGRKLHLSIGQLSGKIGGLNKGLLKEKPRAAILVHDLSFVSNRSQETKFYLFAFFLTLGILIAIVTLLAARWSMVTWIRSVRELVGLMRSEPSRALKLENREFLPIVKDLRGLVRDLEHMSQKSGNQYVTWDAKYLKEVLKRELAGDEIIVVSNRQPYIHNRKDGQIEMLSPASGLVTALEPILKACSGVWVAHGNGNADREVVDACDRIQVPPDHPAYSIRRVWLTPEEEKGYYYGFSNEGLWPLCHIAHARPNFRSLDWDAYMAVNQKFAEAVFSEVKSEDPVVLVQDYHLALVPMYLRQRLPRATIITFWHIPWPNAESFGICPWREELLEGLLGSSIIGFHTQFHCNNFLETVDRYIESRIDKETNTILYRGKETQVRAYPISIEWNTPALSRVDPPSACRTHVETANHLNSGLKIGVGVDRLDYTKGIIERFVAIERLFELYPQWIGKFVFIQIAAPSRSDIEAYARFADDVQAVAARINDRFSSPGYRPIILRIKHHDAKEVATYYRSADVCAVTSLHDGMNLVAKEYISSRFDEKGVLILSMFAGASRELAEALIVNPYDSDQMAMAFDTALSMDEHEQKERMRALRLIVREFNVYLWAGRMLMDAAKVRRKYHLNRKLRRMSGSDSDKNQSSLASLSSWSDITSVGISKT